MTLQQVLALGLPIGGPNELGHQLYDPITAIVGGISAGVSAIGGIFKSNTANSAASAQQTAANAAGQEQLNAASTVNPNILNTAATQGQNVVNTSGDQAVYANKIAQNAASQTTDAAKNASANATAAAATANAGLNPYGAAGDTAAGVLNSGVAQGGEFNTTPTMAQLQLSPGYQFQLQQGEQALSENAAANGDAGGGGYQKDLQNFVQGDASQAYQQAFNNFETSTQNKFADVNAVANSGQAARTTQGANTIGASQFGGTLNTNANEYAGTVQANAAQFGAGLNTNAAQYAGNANINATDLASQNTINAAAADANYRTQGANAKAAGQVAGSNALWGGIGGAANTALATAIYARPSQNYVQRPVTAASNPGYGGAPAGTA